MTFIRFILLILLGWIAWQFGRRWYKNFLLTKQNTDTNSATKPLGTMVRCNHCGLYLPKPEAIYFGEVYYCCEEHKLSNLTGN